MLCHEGVRRREGTVDSATLFIFWLLIVLCQIFPFQTLVRKATGVWHPASFILWNHLVGCADVPPLLFSDSQEGIADLPRFCLFFINFGLELIALFLSAVADIPPNIKEQAKKVLKHWYYILSPPPRNVSASVYLFDFLQTKFKRIVIKISRSVNPNV